MMCMGVEMDNKKEKEAFEAKFKYQSDLDKVVFCEAENKYKALPELKSYELVHQIVGRVNDQWELWQAAKAQAVPESNALLSAAMDAVQKLGSGDFVLVPRVITDEWMAVYVDPVVTKYCKDYEDLPFSVEESELPEIRESHRLPIRNAHKRLMQVIEAQEQSHN